MFGLISNTHWSCTVAAYFTVEHVCVLVDIFFIFFFFLSRWYIVPLAYILCLPLPRWKLKVQQNLLHTKTIKQAQSSA